MNHQTGAFTSHHELLAIVSYEGLMVVVDTGEWLTIIVLHYEPTFEVFVNDHADDYPM